MDILFFNYAHTHRIRASRGMNGVDLPFLATWIFSSVQLTSAVDVNIALLFDLDFIIRNDKL